MHTEHFIVLLLTLDPPRPQMECETLDKEMLDANPDIQTFSKAFAALM
jgi:hypothetical protein